MYQKRAPTDREAGRYLTRYKQAVSETPDVAGLVRDVAVWTHDWIERISRDPPTFADTITRLPGDVLSAFIRDLERKVEQTVQIVNREQHRNERPLVAPLPRHVIPNKGVLAALQAQYVGPGEDRPEGPRHDNDFVDIAKVPACQIDFFETLTPHPDQDCTDARGARQ